MARGRQRKAAPAPPTRHDHSRQLPPERTHTVRVTEDNAGAAQSVVRDITGLPNATVRGMVGHGCVLVDGAPCEDPGTRLAPGTQLVVRYDPRRNYREKPRPKPNRAFRMVFEDAHLVVVEKFAGVLTEPNKGEPDTLVDFLARYLGRGKKTGPKTGPRPWVVHRLDRGTSGLLVLCKRRAVAEGIRQQFRARKPERLYYAVAAGDVWPEKGTIESHLTTDNELNQHSTDVPNAGKLAITHYTVIGRVEGASVLRVRLETGRRNQIRVHMAEAGHSLLGDPRYGTEQARHPLWKADRIALHAATLGFTHPVTEEAMRFTAPPPEEFAPFFPNGLPE